MNKVTLIGRLTRDPEIRYSQNSEQPMSIARYTLAVDRRMRREGSDQNADFISCIAFGKQAEFAEKYLLKGTKIAINGRIQTGSYTNKDGQKIYTTDIVVEDHEFVESKARNASSSTNNSVSTSATPTVDADGFMNIPDGIEEELPFT